MEPVRLKGKEVRRRFQIACAVAHGIGVHMSANQLMEYVWTHGLPSAAERDQMLAERLRDDTFPSTVQLSLF